jgi:hypothetical protein
VALPMNRGRLKKLFRDVAYKSRGVIRVGNLSQTGRGVVLEGTALWRYQRKWDYIRWIIERVVFKNINI